MMWVILGLIVLVGLYLIPGFLERRRAPVDRAFRAQAPGKFAELPGGVTHYRWIGPTRGPVAVLVHGLTTGSAMWEETAAVLADVGYRVLMYDLYNRGFSDSVDGDHDVQLYLTQLDELLEDQGLDEGLTIVGYSMGGIIATEFAATEPHRMRRLVLLAPGGILTKDSRIARFTRDTPILGSWFHRTWGAMRLRRQINEDDAAMAKPYVLKARALELERQGYLPGILACRRGILRHTQERQHRAITHDAIPTIAIWGDEDRVVPIAAVGKMAQWNRKAHHEVIKGAGHEFPYSHIDEVNLFLRRMLRETE